VVFRGYPGTSLLRENDLWQLTNWVVGELPMIHTLRLQNFKGIRDVEIGLERLTVLVGPNGSGKTSFLQGLNFFTEVAFQRHTSGINEDIFLNGYRSWLPSEIPMIFTGSTEYGDLRLTMMSSYEEYMANLKPPIIGVHYPIFRHGLLLQITLNFFGLR